jgi:alpha-tubulin suppressor-like RCC1 family protein
MVDVADATVPVDASHPSDASHPADHRIFDGSKDTTVSDGGGKPDVGPRPDVAPTSEASSPAPESGTDSAPTDASAVGPWQSVGLGNGFGCGLLPDGTAYCWGDNTDGTLGNGAWSLSPQLAPAKVPTTHAFTKLFVSVSGSCALDSSGAAYCWGSDDLGQLGVTNGGCGSTPEGACQTTPAQVFPGHTFTIVSPGRQASCGLDTAGDAYCWGSPGLWGVGGDAYAPFLDSGAGGIAEAIDGPYSTISVGQSDVCAVNTSGAAYCWGSNTSGQLGIGITSGPDVVRTPTAVLGGLTFATINTSAFSVCGVTTSGAGYCWGTNSAGILGTGDTVNHYVPTQVQMPSGVLLSDIEQSSASSCGLTTTGDVYCWGANSHGALGLGTEDDAGAPTSHPVPGLVPGLPPLASLAAGSNEAFCGLTAAGDRYCWGINGSGELGDGTTTNRLTPELIP